jgi:hypothetical protein
VAIKEALKESLLAGEPLKYRDLVRGALAEIERLERLSMKPTRAGDERRRRKSAERMLAALIGNEYHDSKMMDFLIQKAVLWADRLDIELRRSPRGE